VEPGERHGYDRYAFVSDDQCYGGSRQYGYDPLDDHEWNLYAEHG
jgi:hypothetical protein